MERALLLLYLSPADSSSPQGANAPSEGAKRSSARTEKFLRWKLYFPPLEIFFSKGGKLLEILRGVSSS